MIVSFLYESDYADKTFQLVMRNQSAKYKEPLYHKSIEQLNGISGIQGIIIPGKKRDNEPIDYDPKFLIEHIRLSGNININHLPIYIIKSEDDLLDKIDQHLDYAIECSVDEYVDLSLGESLSDGKLKDIIQLIGNEKDNISRHNLSNDWGAYRLSCQLREFLDSSKENDDDIKDELSESIYFKKLFLRELAQEKKQKEKNRFVQIKNKLKYINTHAKKVAVIDDKIESGWADAYSKIFYDSDVKFYDQKNCLFIPEKSKEFDLVILDLRLSEESNLDSDDILQVEKLSGIQLLMQIKRHDPSIPVIISTASNKSWSLKSALDNGADGYWSKEDPSRGVSFDYRFENSLHLIQSLEDALIWSNQTRCIYNAFIDIYNNVSYLNPLVAKSINQKLKIVFGQMHIGKSKFLKKYLTKSDLITSYLAIFSLINEAIALFRERIVQNANQVSWVLTIDGNSIPFCIENIDLESGTSTFRLSGEAYKIIKTVKYIPYRESNLFPEKAFMNLLLQTKGLGDFRSSYGYYSTIRNRLDIIHSKPQPEKIDLDIHDLSIRDHYKILNIFYQIFIGSECDYFPLN